MWAVPRLSHKRRIWHVLKMGQHTGIGWFPGIIVSVNNTNRKILDPQQLSCKIILNPFHPHEYCCPPPHLHKEDHDLPGRVFDLGLF